MQYLNKVKDLLGQIQELAKQEGKVSGFCIGNTAKIDQSGLYFTPIRNTSIMIVGGVIVYSEEQAIDIVKAIDGKVAYILVDAEKKIPNEEAVSGDLANVERAVRENITKSKLWIYKGNDLSVKAVDGLLTQLTKNSLRGIGGTKIAILGAGNLGSKLALELVERGAQVVITRRNKKILKVITDALNHIKPRYTQAKIVGTTNNEKAAQGAKILIGATRGMPVITPSIVKKLAAGAVIVDAGKGVLCPEAIKMASDRGIEIFRLDISAAFEGLINRLWAIENIMEKKLGRRELHGETMVSGGLLGREEEIIVDNVWLPSVVYGIADGRGDFVRNLSRRQIMRIKKLQRLFEDQK
ncbi:MAG: NAD(P)-binding domain-containing protein [Pseudomonadota bacterium]